MQFTGETGETHGFTPTTSQSQQWFGKESTRPKKEQES